MLNESFKYRLLLYNYMVTTIQVHERTLAILKKIREETQSASYDEAINKLAGQKSQKESLAGYLGKKPLKWILKDLRDKHDRY